MSKINPKLKSLFSKILNDYVKKDEITNNIYSEEENIIGTWNGKPLYRKKITTSNTNATSDWKTYTFEELGIPTGLDWLHFTECYTNLIQTNHTYTENFYSVGIRIQSTPDINEINILGNGANYNRYILIVEYTKITD